jgi:hypothetical protein
MQASRISNCVERLFETAPRRHGQIRQNPVTGSSFVGKRDSMGPQKKAAKRALEAKWCFEATKPGDAARLATDRNSRRQLKLGSPLDWLVAEYSASLEANHYDFRKHPEFEDYARGVMASPLAPVFIRKDPELLRRFRPQPLEGLGRGMVWRPPQSSPPMRL